MEMQTPFPAKSKLKSKSNVFYLGERGEIKTFKFPSILFNILASLQTTRLVQTNFRRPVYELYVGVYDKWWTEGLAWPTKPLVRALK